MFNGVGQVFCLGHVLSGAIFLLALLVSHRLSALMAGSMIGLLVAWLWGAAEPAIHSGAFGFNSVLVGIALAVVLPRFGWREGLFSLLAMLITPFVITPFVYAALSAALEPVGMPALTLSFVWVVRVFLLAVRPASQTGA